MLSHFLHALRTFELSCLMSWIAYKLITHERTQLYRSRAHPLVFNQVSHTVTQHFIYIA